MATWNADKPDLANQISADVPDIEENLKELHDVITAITNGTLGTTTAADFRVDGVADAGGTELKVKVVDIGDWDMDATESVEVAHGLTLADIRQIYVLIRNDNNDRREPLDVVWSLAIEAIGAYFVDATNITLGRKAGEHFDSVNYDSTSYNRGWITIWYVA